MCGPSTPSSTPRIGARVDFLSSTGKGHLGNLLFLNPTSPSSSRATHVRFFQPQIPKATTTTSKIQQTLDESVLVSIHSTGDLTQPLSFDTGLLQQFVLQRSGGEQKQETKGQGVEMALGQAVSLDVGGEGIIGRRVSMRRGEEVLADGIVGFNFS